MSIPAFQDVTTHKLKRFVIASTLVLILVVGQRIRRASLVPESHGRPLTYWLSVVDTQPHTNLYEKRKAKRAIREIGAAAKPFLDHELARKDLTLILKLETLLYERIGLDVGRKRNEDRRRMAVWGFFILGDVIQPNERLGEDRFFRIWWEYLVELRKRYKSEWPQVREYVRRAGRANPS